MMSSFYSTTKLHDKTFSVFCTESHAVILKIQYGPFIFFL